MPKGPNDKPFTVYLAGPMSKYKDDPADPYGFRHFHAAARRLRELGVVVMSPAETAGQVKVMPRSWYFAFDFAVIAQCDAVVVLPGWVESRGAMAECIYATEMDIPIYQYDQVTGIGRSLTLTAWDVGVVEGPTSHGWRARVRKDLNIEAPVEAFP